MFWPTHAAARMVGTHWPGCSGSRYLVALPDTRNVNDAERLRHDPGYALDRRRQSGAEERGFAESDGALRDAMARRAQELRCSCRPVWPVDRPCTRPKATPWHRARHGFKREPDPRRADLPTMCAGSMQFRLSGRNLDQAAEGYRQDATVVPNVRRQRGAAPASCARL